MGGDARRARRSHTNARRPADGRGPSRFEPRFRCRRQTWFACQFALLGHPGQRAAAHPATPRYGHRYRPSRPAATCSPAGPRRRLGRSSQAARLGSIREPKGENQRCLHMSHQPFPYDDIWEPVLRVIDAFGLDRCMWGTDWTRTIGMLTYEQGVAPFRDTKRLSENDKAALMGGTLQKVYKW